jgi:hypothetical protein
MPNAIVYDRPSRRPSYDFSLCRWRWCPEINDWVDVAVKGEKCPPKDAQKRHVVKN